MYIVYELSASEKNVVIVKKLPMNLMHTFAQVAQHGWNQGGINRGWVVHAVFLQGDITVNIEWENLTFGWILLLFTDPWSEIIETRFYDPLIPDSFDQENFGADSLENCKEASHCADNSLLAPKSAQPFLAKTLNCPKSGNSWFVLVPLCLARSNVLCKYRFLYCNPCT